MPAVAESASKPRWPAPFGGEWHAFFTFASDYAQNGISNTQLQPAFQVDLDWRSPNLLAEGRPPLWVYGYVFGSNVSFAGVGNGFEVDFSGGLKLRLMEEKLGLSLGYIRYTYPDIAASWGYDYGEVELKADYDFGPLAASGRLRWSPATYSGGGQSWNKRLIVSAPLPFVSLPFGATLQLYGSLGNFWVENPAAAGLPGNDYWYWQVGLVTSVWGLDVTLAYTDTSIEPDGCGYTRACAARAFVAVTKGF